MAVSKLLPQGGANDFNLNVTALVTTATFDKEYSAGSYSIISSGNDTTTDIYAYNASGTLVGYTATKAFTASGGFSKIVVIGGTVGDVLGFTFKKTFTTSQSTAEVTAGAVITSISPSGIPNINNTTTITGANFASDVTVTFTGTGYAATAAKNIVRSNSTTLVVTRPDNFPPSGAPYTITVSNPGVPNPVGSSSHILANAATAGSIPVWSTAAALPVYTRNAAYSQAVVATDADAGSTLTYSVVSSSLPSGITFNTSTAVFSGTPTVSNVTGTATIRVTDGGGNFVDRTFTISNVSPVWSTASGALPNATLNVAYSTTVAATDDSVSALVYGINSGSLPAGLSLNTSSGVISGTPSVYTGLASPASFVLSVTDDAGNIVTRAFTIGVAQPTYQTLTSSQNWTVPVGVTSIDYIVVAGGGTGAGPGSNVGASGGGAGGMKIVNGVTVVPGQSHAAVIGAGGSGFGGSGDSGFGLRGGNSSFLGTSCSGGGGGGAWSGFSGHKDGGSGGGAEGSSGNVPGNGIAGEGNNGGTGRDQYGWCGGGGKGSAGGNQFQGSGYTWVDGVTYAEGGRGAGNGGSAGTNASVTFANRGYGGYGRVNNDSASYGASGVVKIRYLS